jgi:hypothetical protein
VWIVSLLLTEIVPERMPLATRIARPMSRVQTLPASP